MSAGLCLICVLIGLALSILINAKLKHNLGLWALLFAWLIGCFGLGLKTSQLVNMWPVSFTFIVVSLSIFYGYTGKTGVLELIAKKIIYANRNRAWILPFMIFVLSFLMCLAGCSTYAVVALLAPIGFQICIDAGINPILMVSAVMTPAASASFAPWSLGASQPIGYFAKTQWADYAQDFEWYIWGNGAIGMFIAFMVLFIICRGWKAKNIDVDKLEVPGQFTEEHKKVLTVVAVVAVVVIVPALIKLITGFNPKFFGYLDIQFVAIAGSIVLKFMNIGGEKAEMDIIKNRVPWPLIVMVAGVTTLMGVAKAGGAVNLIADAITKYFPTNLIPAAIAMLAGFMTLFSGGMTVVTPTLLPLVEPLYTSANLSPIWTATSICLGANMPAISPVSTGGSICLGMVPNEEWRQKMFIRQFILAGYYWVLMALCAGLGIFNLLHPAMFN
ncbi:MAG: hypothetical protein IJM39_05035 [Firmicutes bacterium]|nr:hypothetical protein [Bacillota bacterium]